jgi:hypothetical protein
MPILRETDFRPAVSKDRQAIPSTIRMDSLLEEAYVRQVEGRDPVFIFSIEEFPTGGLGEALTDIRARYRRKAAPDYGQASNKFEEAYALQFEGRDPKSVFGFEEHLLGTTGDRLERLTLTPRSAPRPLEDWEERIGG